MNICSPKDGFVVKVFVKDGEQVKAGLPLVEMDSDREDRRLQALKAADAFRDIRAAQFREPQVGALQAVAVAQVAIATASFEHAEKYYNFFKQSSQYGAYNVLPLDVVLYEKVMNQARGQKAVAEAQQQQLQYAIARHEQAYTLAKEQSEYLKAFIAKRKKLLTLFSPMNGKIKVHAAEGSFAELGGVLMEVQ